MQKVRDGWRPADARSWFTGNAMEGRVPADGWSLVSGLNGRDQRLARSLAFSPIRRDRAPSAYERVLARAGASHVRDTVDLRVLASVRDRTGTLIDSQQDVGGWPVLEPGQPRADGDGDGMPADWERAHGFDAADPFDGGRDADGYGYTNVEASLNGLVAQ
ncbi:hypothetical protein [Allosphingosinicella deserti]|uniref:hypothetical protein n=1 Tax=Allosphingosinicella deserti TaxID=2116704 RepID=UPI001304928A|nr:hypothetical protein [Sphingomonas deserti]